MQPMNPYILVDVESQESGAVLAEITLLQVPAVGETLYLDIESATPLQAAFRILAREWGYRLANGTPHQFCTLKVEGTIN